MKLSLINKGLITDGLIVLISGIMLHFSYSTLLHDHKAMAIWMLVHITSACILVAIACFHIFYNRWWFKTLKSKIIKSPKVILQRIFTLFTVLSFLSLIITGLMMLCGWYSHHSHIWIWHFALGLTWAVMALCHGSLFVRRTAKIKLRK